MQPSDKQIVIQPKVVSSEQLEQRLQPAPNTSKDAAGQGNERERNEGKDAKSRKSKIKKNKVADKGGKGGKKKGKTKADDKQTEKLSQQITHVQFAFDDYSPPEDVTQPVHQPPPPSFLPTVVVEEAPDAPVPAPATTTDNNELQIREEGDLAVATVAAARKNDQNGNYDELPLIRVDDNSNYETPGRALTRSSESIPFIDEVDSSSQSRSPRLPLAIMQQHQSHYQHHPQHHQYHHLHHQQQQQHHNHQLYHQHESRIITLIPKNLESHNLISPTAAATIVPMQTFLPTVKVSHQLHISAARPIHILPRIDEQRNEPHKFQYYYNPGYKMCQICHLYLHVCPAIKCFECEFVCHRQCLNKVSDLHVPSFIAFLCWQDSSLYQQPL